ncbi:AAA family ATPase [Alkaliphilus crotonatoxidans]
MADIEVKLFQIPMVYYGQRPISFPYRRAEALFYYLVVKGRATREELMGLLWEEQSEKAARKNLRDTLYKIRRAFGADVVISPQKSIVQLNPDVTIHSELSHPLTREEIDWQPGEFLKGFSLKDAEAFETWLRDTRVYFQDQYARGLLEAIDKALAGRSYTRAEGLAKKLILLEPYDERPYQRLLEIYGLQNNYAKAKALYNQLEGLLNSDLGITPSLETRRLFEQIKRPVGPLLKGKEQQERHFFYGRERELGILHQQFNGYMEGGTSPRLLIIGEAGVGKTRLKEKFLESIVKEDSYIFHANCYQAEENYRLKPWNPIISRISDILREESITIPIRWQHLISALFPIFDGLNSPQEKHSTNYQASPQLQRAEEAIIRLLMELSGKRKIILVFDDLQWMDEGSLNLLSHILLAVPEPSIMLLATCRNEQCPRLDGFISQLIREQSLEKINLNRFSRKEVAEFLRRALPHGRVNQELVHQVYQETEGNAFFLVEYVNALRARRNTMGMSSKMKDIIKGRLLGISEEGKKVLNVISIFFDRVSLEQLKAIMERDELELLDMVEELLNKYIIEELLDSDKIYLRFTHQKLQEYVYGQLSMAKRSVLHNRAGLVLEKQLRNDKRDLMQYSRLIYHFSKSGNWFAAVKYRIKNLDAHLAFTHELYPVLIEYNISEKNLYLNRQEALAKLYEIEGLLTKNMVNHINSREVLELKLSFYHMKGRFLIREGEYEQGLESIEKTIALAEKITDHSWILKGYRQLIYYGIQAHNLPLMEEYIEKGLVLAREQGLMGEQGILLRLKGLSYILSSQYQKAEEILRQALAVFDQIDPSADEYALNIAAVYNYLGEAHRHRMAFRKALYYYDQAMGLCKSKEIIRGLAIFNTNAGKAAFDMGDDILAEEYFNRGLEIYQEFDVLWGRAIAEGYTALLQIRRGDYPGALGSLMRADEYSQRLQNPYERGIVYHIKAEIKAQMLHNQRLKNMMEDYLPRSLSDYCDEGITCLMKMRESYEINTLRVLKRAGN